MSFELVQGLFTFKMYVTLSPEKEERKLSEILRYFFFYCIKYRSCEGRYYLVGNLAMSIINTNIYMFIINSRIVKPEAFYFNPISPAFFSRPVPLVPSRRLSGPAILVRPRILISVILDPLYISRGEEILLSGKISSVIKFNFSLVYSSEVFRGWQNSSSLLSGISGRSFLRAQACLSRWLKYLFLSHLFFRSHLFEVRKIESSRKIDKKGLKCDMN